MQYTIKQATWLKIGTETIEEQKPIVMDQGLVVKVDIKAGYPSIIYNLIAPALRHYSQGFLDKAIARVEVGLDILTFSMANCLINLILGANIIQYKEKKIP